MGKGYRVGLEIHVCSVRSEGERLGKSGRSMRVVQEFRRSIDACLKGLPMT